MQKARSCATSACCRGASLCTTPARQHTLTAQLKGCWLWLLNGALQLVKGSCKLPMGCVQQDPPLMLLLNQAILVGINLRCLNEQHASKSSQPRLATASCHAFFSCSSSFSILILFLFPSFRVFLFFFLVPSVSFLALDLPLPPSSSSCPSPFFLFFVWSSDCNKWVLQTTADMI